MLIRGNPFLSFLHFRREKKLIFYNIFQLNYIKSSLYDIIIKIIVKFYKNKIVFFYQNRLNVNKGVPFPIISSFSNGEKSNLFEYISIKLYQIISI